MSTIAELEQKIHELQEKLKVEKQKQEFGYPFCYGDDYWCLNDDGIITAEWWDSEILGCIHYKQGHLFKTKQEAEKERDRRILLTRFRQFRDKCNGEWKPFEYDNQFYLSFDTIINVIKNNCSYTNNSFVLFGYFKNKADAERAIELFGDEIKRLYAEG